MRAPGKAATRTRCDRPATAVRVSATAGPVTVIRRSDALGGSEISVVPGLIDARYVSR